MRKMLIAATSVFAMCPLGSGGAAGAMPAGAIAGSEAFGPTPIARVCREVCDAGVCRRRCWYDGNYGYDNNYGYDERRRGWRQYHWYDRPYYRERRSPGVEFRFGVD